MTGATHGLSHCFFPFPERGYMALCVLGTSTVLGSDSAFLACCPFLTSPPLFSLSSFFALRAPRLENQADPTHDPQLFTTCHTLHSSQGEGGQQFHHSPSFFSSSKANPHPPPLHRPLLFYFRPAPIS